MQVMIKLHHESVRLTVSTAFLSALGENDLVLLGSGGHQPPTGLTVAVVEPAIPLATAPAQVFDSWHRATSREIAILLLVLPAGDEFDLAFISGYVRQASAAGRDIVVAVDDPRRSKESTTPPRPD